MTQKRFMYQGNTGHWEVVIGLEVHAQVTSQAKLFARASTKFGSEPNANVGLLDAGLPGMLPVINQECIAQAVKTGLGFGGQINLYSQFDRKNYFYPDLPLGYQITQHYHPIVGEGALPIEFEDGRQKEVRIERLHLETDAGKSIHDQHPEKTYVDLNRAGVALMEIVTKPDMHSAEEAALFFTKLRNLVRYLGTCDGNMEQGSMRADVNVSVNRPGEDWGTRCEVKNLNSIRFMTQAIHFEAARQIEVLENGGEIIQETRLFDPNKGETRPMRSKEDAQDYRYLPDPDLPPLRLDDVFVEEIRKTLPELPHDKKARFVADFGLPSYDAEVLTQSRDIADYYEAGLEALPSWKGKGSDTKPAKILANWAISELFALLNKEDLTISESKVSAKSLAELVELILSGTISGKIAKDVFPIMWAEGKSADQIVEEKGLKQVSDTGAIEAEVEKIMAQHADKVQEYRAGKEKLFGFFVGQVMKAMAGKANPGVVNQVIQDKLKG